LDRVTSVTAPDPDGSGPLTASVTTTAYTIYSQVASTTDALNGVTSFQYDVAGNQIRLTDPVGNDTTWAYDQLGRVTMETNELSKTRSFTNDSAGNQTRKVDRNGRVIQFVYDELNRLTAEQWLDNASPVPALSISTTTEGGPVDEVQRVGFTASYYLGGGTFTLSFNGQTSSALAHNASAATVQSALQALSTIGSGNVAVVKTQETSQAQWGAKRGHCDL
jgi:YD repeat-containing protein